MQGSVQKEIFILLDVSTSMAGEQEDLAKGVNDLLSQLLSQKGKDECIQVSIDTFNQSMQQLVTPFMLTHDFPRLHPDQFNMDGDTALYDAVGQNLNDLSALETIRLSDVVMVVGTDGRDTVSKTYDAKAVRELVDTYKQKGVSFVYIAAGEGAYEAGVEMGFTTKECKRVVETESIGSCFSSQLVREAISQALGLPEGVNDYPSEFDQSSPKRIKKEEEDEVYSQYF
jgi:uncharacterized protein YegL